VDTWDVAPQAVPDVFSERPVVLFGKWRDGKDEEPKHLVMEGRGADGAYRQTLPLLEALGEGELTIPPPPFPGKGVPASSQGSQADNDPALGRPGGEDQLTSPPPPFPGKGASTSSQGSRIDNDPALGRTGFGERLSALRRLWARQRINDLSDQENLMGDGAQREAITALGLEYSLLTQYTSFVAVDRQIRNLESTAAASVDQPQPLPQGVSDLAVGGAHVPGAPEPKALGALLVTLSMLAMVARRLSRQRRRHLTP
jgi:Ca-activated chloride channel family protein